MNSTHRRGLRLSSIGAAWLFAAGLALVPATALAQPAGAAAAQTGDPKAATAHFEKGVTFFKAKKLGDALAEFRASYAAVQSPNSHLYVARCLAAIGDLRAAYLEFDAVVAEADARAVTEPKYAPTRETARVERDELGDKIALVTIDVRGADPASTLEIGGTTVPRERWGKPEPLAPGAVELVLRGPSGKALTQTITVAARDRRTITLDASAPAVAAAPPVAAPSTTPPPPASRSWMRPAAYASGAVGAAGVVVFAVSGAMANHTYSTLQSECAGHCTPDHADEVSSGKRQQTVANVGLVIGAVGLAAGVTLFVLSPSSSDAKDSAPRSAVALGPGWAGWKGTF
jgi:hypothetical protein